MRLNPLKMLTRKVIEPNLKDRVDTIVQFYLKVDGISLRQKIQAAHLYQNRHPVDSYHYRLWRAVANELERINAERDFARANGTLF